MLMLRSISFLLVVLTLGPISTSAATNSPLVDAAEKSDRSAVRTLLKQRADVNAPQADGMTALHWAARLDDLETARLLVKAGLPEEAFFSDAFTPAKDK